MIEVLSSGYFTTLQDAGRPGFRQFGVPLSGAMDKKAYDLALALLPFKGDRCVFECTLIGPTLKIHQPTRFVLTGGEMECWLDDTPLKMNRVYRAEIGKVLKIGKSTLGIRTYLRFEAHLAVESYLNSVAFYTPITPVQQIKDRDQISFLNVPLRIEENPVHLNVDDSYLNATELNVMAGPDWPLLNLDQQNKLLTESHKIISQNRMGYRLSTALKIDTPNLLSQIVLPGTVQLTPGGQLLIATADCQVTGGYLQILQLHENSLPRLVQKKEGQEITFESKLL